MYKHILVALDASHNADTALQHAIELSRLSGAKLTLAHIINSVDMAIDFPQLMYQPYQDEMGKKCADQLIQRAEKIAINSGLTNIEHFIGNSTTNDKLDVATTLLDYAKQSDTDVIVLGTHGRSGLMHVLMGSFAETIIRQSDIPIMIVRDQKISNTKKS